MAAPTNRSLVKARLPDSVGSEEQRSTQCSLNVRPSIEPDDMDTDESVEANLIRRSQLCASRRKDLHPDLIKKSFRQELEKLGPSAMQLLEKNPTKLCTSRTQSPEPESEEKSLLPFQRRARSNSPLRDDLNLNKRPIFSLFPSQGPVKASKPVVKKLSVESHAFESSELFSCGDDPLDLLTEEYSKLLDLTMAASPTSPPSAYEEAKREPDFPAPRSAPTKKSKITFM